jgi:hypothetical protein
MSICQHLTSLYKTSHALTSFATTLIRNIVLEEIALRTPWMPTCLYEEQ